MMDNKVKEALEVLGFSKEDCAKINVKEVVKSFFKLAKELHPDKHSNDKDKEEFTLKFQAVNSAYQVILEYLQNPENDDTDFNNSKNDESDDVTKFTRDNFKNFNFPKENIGSFTIIVQNEMANNWEEVLEKVYGAGMM